MNVEHQIFEVGVHRCLGVNGRLFIGQQVIELHDTDSDHLVLLRAQDSGLKRLVFYHLVRHGANEVPCIGHVPPVITDHRCVLVASQSLQT